MSRVDDILAAVPLASLIPGANLRSVGKDLRIIRESLVKHEAIRDEHTKSIETLNEKHEEHSKEITHIKIQIAGGKSGI